MISRDLVCERRIKGFSCRELLVINNRCRNTTISGGDDAWSIGPVTDDADNIARKRSVVRPGLRELHALASAN